MKNRVELSVNDLAVTYEREKEKQEAIKNITFHVEHGEIFGVLGESGSGKTTIAKAVMGLVPITHGEIIKNYKQPQMIFQDPKESLNPSMTIGRIIEEPLRIHDRLSKKERKNRVLQMMTEVGLNEQLYDRYPDELSGGQRQRVSIAMSFIRGVDFLVADEAVSALDVTIQSQILELIKKMQTEQQISVLFISHDLKVVYNICDRVMVMCNGEIIEQGITKEIFRNPKSEYLKKLIAAS